MTLPPPRLFNPMKDLQLLPQFAQIHTDCITHDHQLATFLPPLEKGKMEAYWGKIAGRVSSGEVDIVIQFAETSDSDGAEKEVAGYVCLMMPPTETGPFRASVEKLMVSPRHRRKGIAKRVMGVLEDVARSKHRELLILDTTIGLPADDVYPKLGWTAYGVIPNYGISPKDGSLVNERFYYKDLREQN